MSHPPIALAPDPMSAPRRNKAAPASVGTRIRDYRRELGWTQDDLAQKTGVSRSAVAQWETDRAGQIRGNLARIAEALGISVEVLLFGAASRDSAQAVSADEWALLRLYRECEPEDRSFLLRTARRLASGKPSSVESTDDPAAAPVQGA